MPDDARSAGEEDWTSVRATAEQYTWDSSPSGWLSFWLRKSIDRAEALEAERTRLQAVAEAAVKWRNGLGYYPCDDTCSHVDCALARALGVEPMGIPEHLQAPGEPTELAALEGR